MTMPVGMDDGRGFSFDQVIIIIIIIVMGMQFSGVVFINSAMRKARTIFNERQSVVQVTLRHNFHTTGTNITSYSYRV